MTRSNETQLDEAARLPAVALPMASGKHTEANPYGLGFSVQVKGGYRRFFEQRIDPLVQAGYKTFLLHRPFGEVEGGPMDMDARATIVRDEKFQHVIWELEEQLQAMSRAAPDVRFIIYVGTIEEDLNARLAIGQFTELTTRLVRSLGEALNLPNCDICFDAASGWRYRDDLPWDEWVEWVRALKQSQNREVYVEAIPDGRWNEWSVDFNWIALYRHAVRNAQDIVMPGIVWISGHDQGAVDQLGLEGIIEKVRGWGCEPCVNYTYLVDDYLKAVP